MSRVNECAALARVSAQLNASPSFGSASETGCCTGNAAIRCDEENHIVDFNNLWSVTNDDRHHCMYRNLSGHNLRGRMPVSLTSDFGSLQSLILSNNPELTGSLSDFSRLSSLTVIDVSNTRLSGPIPFNAFMTISPSVCTFGETSQLCLPVAGNLEDLTCIGGSSLRSCADLQASVSTEATLTTTRTSLPSVTSTQESRSLPSTTSRHLIPQHTTLLPSPAPRPSNRGIVGISPGSAALSDPGMLILWIVVGSVVAVTLIMVGCLMCAHAARKNKKWEGNIGGLLSSRSKSFFQSLGRNSLLRAPVPPRYESLEGNRAVYDLSAQQMADRFIERNRGKNEFPVKRSHSKELRDELTLTAGDTIILYKVFSDGWAEGVSRRVGGPSIFPVCCLGGSAPLMLQEPDLFRPVTIVTPPRRPRPTHPEPMRMVPGASSMLQAPYIPQRLHQTPLLSNQDSVPYPVTRPLSRFPSASDVGPRHERHHDQPHLLPLQQPDLAVSYNPFKASQIFSPDRDDAESSLSSSSTSSESMGRYLNRDSIYSRPDGYSEV